MTDTTLLKDFKPTFIPWYDTDFRADRTVNRMTPVQRSFYRNLLLDCYFGQDRPYITADDRELWLIAEADSLDAWLAVKELIMTKFSPVELSDGKQVLSNKRVLEEWERLESKLKQRQHAGLASAEARRAKGQKSSAEATKNPPQTPPTPHNITPHNTTPVRSTSVAQAFNDRSTSVQWVMDFFKNLGQMPNRQKVESLFNDKDEDAVKGTVEQWRTNTNFDDPKYPIKRPFNLFYKQFEDWYNPTFESSDHLEQRMMAASAREQQQAEKDRTAKALVVAAQTQSGWVSDPTAI
jgi:uncharacterized protein YdaU (DUF1376 family)